MSATRFRAERVAGPGTAGQDSRRYLLFAGTQQPPNGGLCDLVDTFTCEEAARRAFREVRLQAPSTTSWAQLAVVDDHAGIKPLCWFGIGADPGRYRPAIDRPATGTQVTSADRSRVPNTITALVAALILATALIAVFLDADRSTPAVKRQPAASIPMEASR